MFKLLRYYSVTSFIAIVAAAILLTWFYRQVAVENLFRLVERSNRNLAQVAMNPIKPELLAYVEAAADPGSGRTVPQLPAELAQSINELMRDDRFVVRIKIYNLQGRVLFSTRSAQIGDDQSRNEGVIGARNGEVTSVLVYRDMFNSFDEASEEDNLVQTYVPIRAAPTAPVKGVFELYGDVNDLMHQVERMEFIVIGGAIPILLALYAALWLIVRHAHRAIEEQQRTIHERNEALALMSAHMLKTQESQNKQVAFDLHEGVAQTLATLKLRAEKGLLRAPKAPQPGEPPDSIIPMLQDAIQEVRTIATDLHPSSLDDLGLLPTLNSLARDFAQRHSGIAIVQRNSVQESDIPASLRAIVYRIVDSVLGEIAQQADHARVVLALARNAGGLALLIDATLATDITQESRHGPATVAPGLESAFLHMQELVILSGGAFTSSQRADGGTTLSAQWSV